MHAATSEREPVTYIHTTPTKMDDDDLIVMIFLHMQMLCLVIRAHYTLLTLIASFAIMNRDTLNTVFDYMGRPRELLNLNPKGMTIEKKIAMTCAYLGSKATTLSLAHQFGCSEETFLRQTETVINVMVDNLHQVIRFPSKRELATVAHNFDPIGRYFNNVIGAIDDQHVPIQCTEEAQVRDSYRNYKQYHSIHLQATTTWDLRFLHCFVGFPGRAHDALVFRNSPITDFLADALHVPGRGLRNSFHILGDKAFPLLVQLMTPYKDYAHNPLTHAQRIFNQHLSSKRQNVERSFALLMQRFPRMQYLNMKSLQKKIKVVLASCMLHNICIMERDNVTYFLHKAAKRTVRVHNPVHGPLLTRQNSALGRLKRDALVPDIVAHHN